jgi:hypothetical protein
MIQRVLVCGGRNYANKFRVFEILDTAHEANPICEVVHGDCHLGGADLLAKQWAQARGVPERGFPVDHDVDGPWPAAGPRRNERMLTEAKPHMVIAFPGGKGTAGMCRLAHTAGVPVVVIR